MGLNSSQVAATTREGEVDGTEQYSRKEVRLRGLRPRVAPLSNPEILKSKRVRIPRQRTSTDRGVSMSLRDENKRVSTRPARAVSEVLGIRGRIVSCSGGFSPTGETRIVIQVELENIDEVPVWANGGRVEMDVRMPE